MDMIGRSLLLLMSGLVGLRVVYGTSASHEYRLQNIKQQIEKVQSQRAGNQLTKQYVMQQSNPEALELAEVGLTVLEQKLQAFPQDYPGRSSAEEEAIKTYKEAWLKTKEAMNARYAELKKNIPNNARAFVEAVEAQDLTLVDDLKNSRSLLQDLQQLAKNHNITDPTVISSAYEIYKNKLKSGDLFTPAKIKLQLDPNLMKAYENALYAPDSYQDERNRLVGYRNAQRSELERIKQLQGEAGASALKGAEKQDVVLKHKLALLEDEHAMAEEKLSQARAAEEARRVERERVENEMIANGKRLRDKTQRLLEASQRYVAGAGLTDEDRSLLGLPIKTLNLDRAGELKSAELVILNKPTPSRKVPVAVGATSGSVIPLATSSIVGGATYAGVRSYLKSKNNARVIKKAADKRVLQGARERNGLVASVAL
jgi:hypothetical protein